MLKDLLIMVLATVAFTMLPDEFLNDKQEGYILQELDSLCADTWCEGSYRYYFNFIRCSKSDDFCTVEFASCPSGTSENCNPDASDLKCDIPAKKYTDIIDRMGEIRSSFADGITSCIEKIEAGK